MTVFEERRLFAGLAACLLVSTFGFGCKPPPKPNELQELERILRQPGANEVEEAPGARKYYQKSRELRRLALEAHEDRELKRSRSYAVRGKIYYRIAEAVKKQYLAKKKLEKANTKIEKINPKVSKLAKERAALQKEVRQLRRKLKTKQRKAAGGEPTHLTGSDVASDDKGVEEAKNAIKRAADAKRRAESVRAHKFAEPTYNRAANQLASARQFLESSPPSVRDAKSAAERAREQFLAAKKAAEPKYEEFKAKQNPQKRLATLTKKLKGVLTGGLVEKSDTSVRAIVPRAFGKESSTFEPGRADELKRLAKLAKEYDEFRITIEAFTRKGNATDSLNLSKVRARKTSDLFENRAAVAEDRISASGMGQGRNRFPNSPAKNDRVEVVYRLPAK
ncbi:MAG: hypothetical protein ABEL76_08755 [Bradymonadaceae bacterium]